MASIKHRVIDTNQEERLITGLIISTSFCRDVIPLMGKETLEVPYMEKIAKWCKDYYNQYKEAPGIHIQHLYEIEKEKLEPSEQEAISSLLGKLSDDYSTSDINEDFLKNDAIKLIDSRSLLFSAKQAIALAEVGRAEEARKMIKGYREKNIETTGWFDPFEPEVVKNHYADEEMKKSHLFKLQGELGNFIGPFEKNWLVGIMGPPKRGKTFWLIELAVQAIIARKKVIFISLEMDEQRIRRRIYTRLTAAASETRDYIFPVFDCLKNQSNVCNKPERCNNIRLLDSEDQKPQYNRDLRYTVCTACRGQIDFIPAYWYTSVQKEKARNADTIKRILTIAEHFGYHPSTGSNLRVLAYPAFSANLARIRNDIQTLREVKKFYAHLIDIDYADILAPEDARITGRDRIDETWKTLKNMSDEMSCMVASGSQSNRESIDVKNVTQKHTAEDIRKIANSDLFLAVNQTPQEKKSSVTRISKIAKRDGDFDQYEGCIVLQQLALGQVHLDSYMDHPAVTRVDMSDDYFE